MTDTARQKRIEVCGVTRGDGNMCRPVEAVGGSDDGRGPAVRGLVAGSGRRKCTVSRPYNYVLRMAGKFPCLPLASRRRADLRPGRREVRITDEQMVILA